MKLFEFEAKNILKEYGIAVPRGSVASNSAEAEAADCGSSSGSPNRALASASRSADSAACSCWVGERTRWYRSKMAGSSSATRIRNRFVGNISQGC